MSDSSIDRLWPRAYLIRAFEERLLSLFAEGKLQGTVHTCSGQEWSALAVAQALGESDTILSNHRGHGHFLARRPDLVRPLLAEIMGLEEGLCGGVGGSQHLYAPGFYSNGVQGGMTPVAAGLALAGQMRGNNALVAVFIGDGTTGEGIVYEAMNLAAMWKLPLLMVLERNGYAQSTSTSRTLVGDMRKRAEGFGFAFFRGEVWRERELCAEACRAASHARSGAGPALLEIECFRLNAHSKGDDNRPEDLVAAYRERDPLAVFRRENPALAGQYESAAEKAIEEALAAIASGPCRFSPKPDVFREEPEWRPLPVARGGERYGESLYRALKSLMERHGETLLLGEDIEAPYGGAFRITRDLSKLFPGRVRNTPISEAALIGVGTGLALGGMRPVVEIMFGDFLTLAFDQLQQHAAKFPAMSNGVLAVPLIVRAPSGGRRGYGPTHSQSLEKHFLGIPGLTVLALNGRVGPSRIYDAARRERGPVLMIENKTLYSRFWPGALPPGYVAEETCGAYPTVRLRPSGGGAGVTVVCYGGMLEVVEEAVAEAFRLDEIVCEVACYSCLSPLDCGPLLDSVSRTGRLLTVEEGPGLAGWGAELAAQASYAGVKLKACRRVSYDGIIPASANREAALLPGVETICAALRALHG